MIFASGVVANAPNSPKASPIFWSSFKNSGKLANILPAKEIFLVSIVILAGFVKAFTIGKNECVANIGASSVMVYIIFDCLDMKVMYYV